SLPLSCAQALSRREREDEPLARSRNRLHRRAMTLEARLTDILRADPALMQVLSVLRDLDLPDWRLFSGAVYQAVWNAQTDRPVGYGIKDYDIGYFDPDVSWDAEDVVIKRVAAAFAP